MSGIKWTEDYHGFIGNYKRHDFMVKPTWILKSDNKFFFKKKITSLKWILKYSAHAKHNFFGAKWQGGKKRWEILTLEDSPEGAKDSCTRWANRKL